jgi:hypothetical protein
LSVLKRFRGFGGEIPREEGKNGLEWLESGCFDVFRIYCGLLPVFFKGS